MQDTIPIDHQEADIQTGLYYVTVQTDDGRHHPLLGPYLNDHATALERVVITRLYASQLDSRFTWLRYGTSRLPLEAREVAPNGALNSHWPLEFMPGTQIVRSLPYSQ